MVGAVALAGLYLAAAGCGGGTTSAGSDGTEFSQDLEFNHAPPGSDPAHGQAVFGIAADGVTGDPTQAEFTGFSARAGTEIAANGRTCFSCHRPTANFMINPLLPLSANLPADDPLLRPDAVLADSGGNPDAPALLNEHGLVLIRPHRFDASPGTPRYAAFGWRKVPTNLNTAFAHGFLNDLRTVDLENTDLGAAMAHTQDLDLNHDDMIPAQAMADLAAFQLTLFTDPRLATLAAGRGHAGFADLAAHPYATVPAHTAAERRGERIFDQFCFVCHDVPNVFNNRSHRPAFLGAPIGEAFNIGVAEANALGLDFRQFDPATGQRTTVVLPLLDDDGQSVDVPLEQDPGLALITGRLADLGRFKVPQLRNLRLGKPYFHDCSAPDLEAVVAYFNSPAYNDSPDGQRFPIALTAQEQSDLLAFLNVL